LEVFYVLEADEVRQWWLCIIVSIVLRVVIGIHVIEGPVLYSIVISDGSVVSIASTYYYYYYCVLLMVLITLWLLMY